MTNFFHALTRSATSLFLIAAAGLVAPAFAAQQQGPRPSDIPIGVFADLPSFSRAKLSTSGRAMAYLVSIDGREHVAFINLDGSGLHVIPPHDKAEIMDFYWANDNVILVVFGFTSDRWAFRKQFFETRVFAYDTQSLASVWLGEPRRESMRDLRQYHSPYERVVDLLPADPDHVLMQMNFELNGKPAVYEVDVRTGARREVQYGQEGIQNWNTDTQSNVRFGSGYWKKKRYAKFKDKNGNWIDLTKTDWEEKYKIRGFTPEDDIVYVSGPTEWGTDGLFKLDLRSGEIVETVFANEQYDVGGIVEHPTTGRLAGISYTDTLNRVLYLDPDLKKLQASIERVMPGMDVSITGKARDKELYLIVVSNGQSPGDYYLYNRDAGHLEFLASVRESLATFQDANPEIMKPSDGVTIPMRDGTSIPGYLTLPSDREAKNLPAVILPHGGPWARDSGEWDWWSHFYASRGYAVLQPNFRGSTGYGKAFLKAGEHQWGGLMQDDVTDATKWLSDQGIADPKRICIIGASYGGYAALMGVIKEPGLYACAVSVNGVTDLPRLKSGDKQIVGSNNWLKQMGLKGAKDEDVSPYDRAKDVSAPVLLMSSKDDQRIDHVMSADLDSKLRRIGKNSRYVEIENGTHWMLTRESRLLMLTETEKFLQKYIGK